MNMQSPWMSLIPQCLSLFLVALILVFKLPPFSSVLPVRRERSQSLGQFLNKPECASKFHFCISILREEPGTVAMPHFSGNGERDRRQQKCQKFPTMLKVTLSHFGNHLSAAASWLIASVPTKLLWSLCCLFGICMEKRGPGASWSTILLTSCSDTFTFPSHLFSWIFYRYFLSSCHGDYI